MSILNFLKPVGAAVPPPGTSAHKAYLRATGSSADQGAAAYAAQQSVPPPGTSARNAYEYYQKNGESVPTIPGALGDDSDNPSTLPYPPSAAGLAGAPVKQSVLDYINADLAEYYGMTKATAYQEALSNTAYQRALKDMRDAGLNPAVLFGAGHAQSANSSLYAAEERSGGGGGYSRSGSGGKSKNGKLFSTSVYGAISSAAGLIASVATKNPGNYWVGNSIAQGAMNFANALWQM